MAKKSTPQFHLPAKIVVTVCWSPAHCNNSSDFKKNSLFFPAKNMYWLFTNGIHYDRNKKIDCEVVFMLQNKIAVVTGGTRGIGYAIVQKFLQNGAKVVLFGSREETVVKRLLPWKKKTRTGTFPAHGQSWPMRPPWQMRLLKSRKNTEELIFS